MNKKNMSEARATKTIELSISKLPVVLNTYLLAGEYLDAMSVQNTNQKLIESFVVSIGGKTENIWNEVRALQVLDYKQIDKELGLIIETWKEKKS